MKVKVKWDPEREMWSVATLRRTWHIQWYADDVMVSHPRFDTFASHKTYGTLLTLWTLGTAIQYKEGNWTNAGKISTPSLDKLIREGYNSSPPDFSFHTSDKRIFVG